jgi:Ca2+/H+ antiporter, TMEM165/GDT1 family
MRGRWVVKVFAVSLFVLIVAPSFAVGVLYLWNWLMPSLFGMHYLTFWQALGLLWLSWILFRGPRGWPGGGMPWRRRMMERWEQMTPEEREKFRGGMGRRCGHHEAPTAKTTA